MQVTILSFFFFFYNLTELESGTTTEEALLSSYVLHTHTYIHMCTYRIYVCSFCSTNTP